MRSSRFAKVKSISIRADHVVSPESVVFALLLVRICTHPLLTARTTNHHSLSIIMRFFHSGLFTFLTLISFYLLSNWVDADIELPKLFSDHMVLQQNRSMRIHGRADAQEELTIRFHKQVVEAVAADNGKWSAVISTGPAGGLIVWKSPQKILKRN